MYPYHNRIKQRIKNGELLKIEQSEGEYAFVFVFKTYPYKRPIKKVSVCKYDDILKNLRDKN